MPAQYVDNETRLIEEYRAGRADLNKLSDRCSILRRSLFHKDAAHSKIRGQRMYCYVMAESRLRGQPAGDIITEALCDTLEEFLPVIFDGELIVGYNYDDAEYETTVFKNRGDNGIRALMTFLKDSSLTPEQREALTSAVRSGYSDKFCNSVLQLENKIEYTPVEKELLSDGAGYGICTSNNHSVPDYEKVLKLGFKGIYKRLEKYPDTVFFRRLRRVCNACLLIGEKYAATAEELAANESGVRKSELLRIAENCRVVPAYPARTFYQAVQSVWFSHIINTWEDGVNANSLGRLDQILYPYYKADIESGEITKAGAFELICCLWIKLYLSYDVSQCTVGGYDKDGNDACNELSYMMLDAMEELDITRCLSVRYNKKTERAFCGCHIRIE